MKYAKAFMSGLVTGLSTAAALTVDSGLSLNDVLVTAAAAVASFAAVFGIRNSESGV